MKNKILNNLLVGIPLAATFLLYKPVLNSHFNWEDATFLGEAAKVLTSGNHKYLFIPWYGRYARILWQFISVFFLKIFGYNATPFFTLALTLHLFNIILTYFLAIKLTKSKFIAFFSSFLYGVYQINSSSISWISSGVKDVPMTTFFLLSLIFFICHKEKNEKRFMSASIMAFFFAFCSEFKAILIPFVLIAYDYIFHFPKTKKIKNIILEYLPFFLITIFLSLTFYSSTFKRIPSAKNWNFWQTFFAGLPVYFLPFSRIFWLRIYTDAHNLTRGLSDESFLKLFGALIFIYLISFNILLIKIKQNNKAKIFIFLFLGMIINYIPVLLTVFTEHHSSWNVITVHWRYFLICSPIAAILVCSLIVWTNDWVNDISKKFCERIFLFKYFFNLKLLPFLFLATLTYFHISSDKILLDGYFLNWTFKAKENLLIIKNTYPVLPKETVFIVEGTDDENKFPFFQHRYLFENIFAMYANSNNPNYLKEQKIIPFNPAEHSDRNLKRVLYYTNIKDFLIGDHRHMYNNSDDITFISPTIPWSLPAYDRLFLGAIQGDYDPDKIIDFSFSENGSVKDVTDQRKLELKKFLNYFCFENGVKKCPPKSIQTTDSSVSRSINLFSDKGKQILDILIKAPLGKTPGIEKIKIN